MSTVEIFRPGRSYFSWRLPWLGEACHARSCNSSMAFTLQLSKSRIPSVSDAENYKVQFLPLTWTLLRAAWPSLLNFSRLRLRPCAVFDFPRSVQVSFKNTGPESTWCPRTYIRSDKLSPSHSTPQAVRHDTCFAAQWEYFHLTPQPPVLCVSKQRSTFIGSAHQSKTSSSHFAPFYWTSLSHCRNCPSLRTVTWHRTDNSSCNVVGCVTRCNGFHRNKCRCVKVNLNFVSRSRCFASFNRITILYEHTHLEAVQELRWQPKSVGWLHLTIILPDRHLSTTHTAPSQAVRIVRPRSTYRHNLPCEYR